MAHESHNWLVNKIADAKLDALAEKYFTGRLIDIGCGSKPYRGMLQPYVGEHIGVDLETCVHGVEAIDIFGTAYQIPVQDDSFQCALCSAVLEHLEEPETAIRECYRVLCSEGVAIYSVPFIWHVHEAPRDFYRFSRYGLEYLFRKVGFQTLEIIPLSGFVVTFGQELVYFLQKFKRGPLRFIPLIDLLSGAIQSLCMALNRYDKTHGWTWMYMVVARKPKTHAGDRFELQRSVASPLE